MNIASQKYPELNHQTASPKPSPLGYLAIQGNWKMLVILNILKCIYFALWDFPHGAGSKEPACQCRRQRDVGLVPGWGRSPGRGHGTHSRILAGRVSWMEEPSRLESIGSQRVRQKCSDLACMCFAFLKDLPICLLGTFKL